MNEGVQRSLPPCACGHPASTHDHGDHTRYFVTFPCDVDDCPCEDHDPVAPHSDAYMESAR